MTMTRIGDATLWLGDVWQGTEGRAMSWNNRGEIMTNTDDEPNMIEIPLRVRKEWRGLLGDQDKWAIILQKVLDRVSEYKIKNKQMENDARDVLRIPEIADMHNIAYQCYLRIEEIIIEETLNAK